MKKFLKISAYLIVIATVILCLVSCNTQEKATVDIKIVDGFWIINGENTGVKAEGKAPEISLNSDGYWVINGENTGVKAEGTVPEISIDINGYWVINGNVTDTKATGKDGVTPQISISKDKYWIINGENIGIKAEGKAPEISVNSDGYWVVDGTVLNVKAEGTAPTITINDSGYWVINGIATDTKASGKGIFEAYKEIYGYEGTEAEWLNDVVNGTLDIAVKRKVTFDYNGVEPGEDMPVETSINDGRTLVLPTPERLGYTFLGWYTGLGVNDGKWSNTLIVSSDLNLIAKWQKDTFTVRFEDINGELLSTQTVEYGESAVAPTVPNVENYVFVCWSENITNVTNDLTVRPEYSPLRYTVTYDTDGGNEIAAESYTVNQTPVAPVEPQKSGYVFTGWKNAESGEKYNFDTPLLGDVTLVAIWSDTIRISSVEELVAIADNPNVKYSLSNDINLKGAEWAPLPEFGGVLDGDGHRIYNFIISSATAEMGFVKVNNGTIRNIVFSDVAVTNEYNGVSNTCVVAAVNNGIMENVTVRESTVTRNYSATNVSHDGINVGGVVGVNNGNMTMITVDILSNIKIYCSATDRGTYCTYILCGGVVGTNFGKIVDIDIRAKANYTITSSHNYNSYTYYDGSMNAFCKVGGIVGRNSKGNVEFVYSNVDYELNFIGSGNRTPVIPSYVGGIVGYNENGGEIIKTRTEGEIIIKNSGDNIGNGVKEYGGIVGRNATAGQIDEAMSEVNFDYNVTVQSGSIGGIAGGTETGSMITNCMYTGKMKAQSGYYLGGIVGNYGAGSVSYCVFKGILELDAAKYSGGLTGDIGSGAVIMRCINDGQIIATNGGTPQYVSSDINGKTVTKCYRTERATITVDETLTDGTQAEAMNLKPVAELYTAEIIYDELYFDAEVWKINETGIYLAAV